MKWPEGSWEPAAITLALVALVIAAAPALTACRGTAVTASPQATSGTGPVQPTERHGHLGDAIVLSDGGDGQLEVTARGLKFVSYIGTGDSTMSSVYGVKLKLRNVGSAPIHMADVGASSVLFDAGGWRYFPPDALPKNALNDVDLGPGDSRAGWVYFAVQVAGGAPKNIGAPSDFQYTAKSSDVTAEGDTGEWRWKPGKLY